MTQTLRPYQALAIDSLRAELRAGRRKVLLVGPTASGKTTEACAMISGASAKGMRTLFLVHRRELVEQAHDRMTAEGFEAGVIMAGVRPTDRRVQVASVQTLARRPKPEADLVIVDEAHHAVSASYAKILDHYSRAFVIGLTASPWRLDGRGLGDVFESSVVAATPAQLIKEGYLCDYAGFRYQAPDLGSLSVRGGDYLPSELTVAYQNSRIVADVLDRWKAHASGLRTILFAPSIESSRDFCARFVAAGVKAEHLDFETPTAERRAVMNRVRSGETQLLCNVSLITEGVDVPELQCCILARPTKSLALYLQMVGRCLRPKADGGKALIHDHAENVARHGLPDAPRDYSLTTTKPREVVPALRTCKFCFAIWEPPRATCPQCGQAPAQVEREGPEQVDGVEVDIRGATRTAGCNCTTQDPRFHAPLCMSHGPERNKRELIRQAIAHGRKPGWVVHRFLEMYPGAPKPWGAYREVRDAQA